MIINHDVSEREYITAVRMLPAEVPLAARAVFTYLLSYPSGYRIMRYHVSLDLGISTSTVGTAIRWLRENGYWKTEGRNVTLVREPVSCPVLVVDFVGRGA